MVRLFYTEVKHTGKLSGAQALHLAAHEMLRQGVLSCLTGITGRPARAVRMQLAYGAHGKPYLASHPSIEFSLSHAGSIALCAVSEEVIGADVQDHRPLSASRIRQIGRRFYASAEQALLEKETDGDALKTLFFRLWAAKEAYAKMTGRGMSEDFTSFSADLENMRILSVPDKEEDAPRVLACLKEPLLLPACSVMLCTERPVRGEQVTCLVLDETFTAVTRGL